MVKPTVKRMIVTLELLTKAMGDADWDRLRAMTDADIDANPAADPAVSEAEITAARVRGVRAKTRLS